MLKEKALELLNEAFEERPDLYLIDFKMGASNDMKVIIDGDNGVTLADCVFVSRAVEHNLDRDEVDFSIEVTSAGATTPLELPRQYKKNIGRTLEITDRENRSETGELISVQENGVTIKWKARVPKTVGKGKMTVEKEWSPSFEEIKKAKVVIKFN